MAVNSTGNTSAADIYSSLNTTQTKATSEIDAAQNRFLMLLTTQLKMQDPLNPMDNAQVTSQLAQISTVDGITKLNKTLETLSDSSMTSQQALERLTSNALESQQFQAASLIGRAVLVEGNDLKLFDGKSMGAIELAADAAKVTVSIKNSNGVVVKELELDDLKAGIAQFHWDGTDRAGVPVAADGKYSFSVKAINGKDNVVTTPLHLAVVNNVQRIGNNTQLDLKDQGVVSINNIKQIF